MAKGGSEIGLNALLIELGPEMPMARALTCISQQFLTALKTAKS
jgi:hypothetical protein